MDKFKAVLVVIVKWLLRNVSINKGKVTFDFTEFAYAL